MAGDILVGAPGFEPGASCAQGRRATRLRYAPTCDTSILAYFLDFSTGPAVPCFDHSCDATAFAHLDDASVLALMRLAGAQLMVYSII